MFNYSCFFKPAFFFRCFIASVFLLNALAAQAAIGNDVTNYQLPNLAPTPYKKSFVLYSNIYTYIYFAPNDYINCPSSTYFVPGRCPTGYNPKFFFSVVRVGSWDGSDTGHDLIGYQISFKSYDEIIQGGQLGYRVNLCAGAWFASGQGNSDRAWLSTLTLCNSADAG